MRCRVRHTVKHVRDEVNEMKNDGDEAADRMNQEVD